MTAQFPNSLSILLRRYGPKQALLFTGAGFSTGAINSQNEKLPTGGDVISYLQTKVNDTGNDLGLLSRLYIKDFGEHELFRYLTSNFQTKSVSDYYKSIIEFPWKAVYTTNYDDVSEFTATQSGIPFQRITQDDAPNYVGNKQLPIIHLNGSIHNINIGNFQEKIRLTSTSYLAEDIGKSAWGQHFRSDIFTSPCIIFAGYSMFDLDIQRIVYKFSDIKDRIFFVTEPNPPRSLREKLEEFGQVIDCGLEPLAKFLEGISSKKFEGSEPLFTAIDRYPKLQNPSKKPNDTNVRDLLIYGDVDDELVFAQTVTQGFRYFIERDSIAKASSLLAEGSGSTVVFRSEAGNGKTIAAQAVAHAANSAGAEVFRIENNTKRAHEELSQIKNLDGRILFFIDDLFSSIDIVRSIKSLNLPQYSIITCARPTVYDLRIGEVNSLFGNSLFEFDLDKLSNDERNGITSYFNEYGLWQKLQARTDAQKDAFIRNECASELRTILLHFLDSEPIKEKIKEVFENTGKASADQNRLQKLVIMALLVNLADYQANTRLLSDILGFDTYVAASKAKGEIRTFTKMRNDRFVIRSPIFSEYVIKKILDVEFLIDTMIDAMTRLDEIRQSDRIFGSIMRTFVRFSFLESVFPQNRKRDHIVRYYESMKVLSYFEREPLFWLQYAIARLSLREYRAAKDHFDVAYSFSHARGYIENRHLDNQYARFLLESRTFTEDYADHMDAFNKAHQILIKQMIAEETTYQPYRVATHYYDFAVRRQSALDTRDRIIVSRACLEILKRIETVDSKIRNYSAVSECENRLRQTLQILPVQ